METVRDRAALMTALAPLRRAGEIALVPTMGALHDGHLALLAQARASGASVVTSVFVNPTQFAPGEDFAAYPRDADRDRALLEQAGCAVAWFPDAETIYPAGFATRIAPAGPALGFEGAARPEHFSGVATVVARLLGLCRPDRAYFGEKDWQQLQVVRRMVDDLAFGVGIVAVPTMREPDGLALSSRNRFLTPAQRQAAPLLYRCLQRARAELERDSTAEIACAAARRELTASGFEPDYVALVAGASLSPIAQPEPGARLIAAARLGAVRLLDNLDASPDEAPQAGETV